MSCVLTFLHARLDEDEQRARAEAVLRDGDPYFVNEASNFERCFTPQRALAEVEAKREILKLHRPGRPIYEAEDSTRRTCWSCGVDDGWYDVPAPCDTLKALALPYADHPDYDPAWSVQ